MDLNTFILKFVNSKPFKNFIMAIILINTFTTAFYASFSKNPKQYRKELFILEILDSIFLGIYTIEFILKVYTRPRAFFYNGFNCFDFLVLVLSYSQMILAKFGSPNLGVFKVLRSVRALRPLRSVSFIGGLQVIVSALLTTLRTSFLHIMTLLSVVMFVFGIMGYYMFGYTDTGNNQEWGSFIKCVLSLFVLVTAEGWPTIEANFHSVLPPPVLTWSRVYVVIFLFVGHFVFSNLFVAVIIGQIDKATSEFEMKRITKRNTDLEKRKKRVESEQSTEIKSMLENLKSGNDRNQFRNTVLSNYQYMRSDDFRVIRGSQVCCSGVWVNCFSVELNKLAESVHGSIISNRQIVNELCDTAAAINKVVGDEGGVFSTQPSTMVCNEAVSSRRRHAVQHPTFKPSLWSRCWNCLAFHFSECTCQASASNPHEEQKRPTSRLIEVKPAPNSKRKSRDSTASLIIS